jgi:hypothetical protein
MPSPESLTVIFANPPEMKDHGKLKTHGPVRQDKEPGQHQDHETGGERLPQTDDHVEHALLVGRPHGGGLEHDDQYGSVRYGFQSSWNTMARSRASARQVLRAI